MVSAATTARMQVLVRMKNKTELRQMLLQEQKNTLNKVYSETQREYYKAFYYATGSVVALTDEQQDTYNGMLEKLEALMISSNQKENSIDSELKNLETKAAMYQSEIKNLEELIKKQATSDAPHLSGK